MSGGENMAKRAVRQGILARSSASGYDQVNFRGAGLPVRRMQPYGLRSRPPAGAMLTLVSVNAGRTNVAYLAAEKPGQGPADLEEGEVALYNGAAQVLTIRLTKDGDIQIIPAAGRKVKLGSKDDGELDPVVLYSKLKEQFDRFVLKHNQHTHVAGTLVAGMVPVTGATAATPDTMEPLTAAAGSSNVVAKK